MYTSQDVGNHYFLPPLSPCPKQPMITLNPLVSRLCHQPQSWNLLPLLFPRVLALVFVIAQNLFGCACPRIALTRIRGDVRYPQNLVPKYYFVIQIPLRIKKKKKVPQFGDEEPRIIPGER